MEEAAVELPVVGIYSCFFKLLLLLWGGNNSWLRVEAPVVVREYTVCDLGVCITMTWTFGLYKNNVAAIANEVLGTNFAQLQRHSV